MGRGLYKKRFFVDDDIARTFRKELSEDKDKEDISNVKSNLGSRLDFIQIIKGLVKDKDVEILEYNEELTQLIADELDKVKIDILKDVEEIALKTGNEQLREEITKISLVLQEEIAKKEEAERKAREAQRRLEEEIAKKEEAERKAHKAEEKRKEAEQRKREEEIARKQAQLKAQEEELKRIAAELKEREAEQKAKEEEEKRKKADENRKKAEALAKKKEKSS